MSAFKGTPGPWAVNPVSAQVDAMPSLLPVCQLLWPTDQRSEAETEANARLIAAAPDLLDALHKLAAEVVGLRAFESELRAELGNTNWNVLMLRLSEADAAIAKAEGRT